MTRKRDRTSKGLRDILFDEIEELRTGNGDPTKSLAVAKLAQQIIGTAKVEMLYHETMAEDGQAILMGTLQLGSAKQELAADVEAPATGH